MTLLGYLYLDLTDELVRLGVITTFTCMVKKTTKKLVLKHYVALPLMLQKKKKIVALCRTPC